MKNIFYLLLFIILSQNLFSQSSDTKTVLFLIPFHSDQFNEDELPTIKECNDIYNIPSFDFVGFWEGAKKALDEYEKAGVNLNVIVRDVSDKAVDLYKIMNNESLMREVDLIIGPFFGSTFTLAAEFANYYKIPIVNPFSKRVDFANNNEWVYKLIPSYSARPTYIQQQLLKLYPHNNIILWADTTAYANEFNAYKQYFTDNNIPFQVVNISSESIVYKMKKNTHNIVVALFDSQTEIINQLRMLTLEEARPAFTLIVPEDWIDIQDLDIDYFSKLNVHYFSNYFVDYRDEKTLLFVSEFIEEYASQPDLQRYSFQGYDITKYFIELLRHDFSSDMFNFTPISFDFSFRKIENAGHENQKIRLIEIENNEIKLAE